MGLRIKNAVLWIVVICCNVDMGGVNEKFYLQDATE